MKQDKRLIILGVLSIILLIVMMYLNAISLKIAFITFLLDILFIFIYVTKTKKYKVKNLLEGQKFLLHNTYRHRSGIIEADIFIDKEKFILMFEPHQILGKIILKSYYQKSDDNFIKPWKKNENEP